MLNILRSDRDTFLLETTPSSIMPLSLAAACSVTSGIALSLAAALTLASFVWLVENTASCMPMAMMSNLPPMSASVGGSWCCAMGYLAFRRTSSTDPFLGSHAAKDSLVGAALPRLPVQTRMRRLDGHGHAAGPSLALSSAASSPISAFSSYCLSRGSGAY